LLQKDQQAYKVLSRFRVHAHASGNEGISIQPAEAAPVLTHATDRGGLTQVRWNTADRAGVQVTIGPNMESWYDAAA
jgi:trimethyllysine dioxygenase